MAGDGAWGGKEFLEAFKQAFEEGITHAGLLVVARDTGAMLLIQRAYDETDDPEVQETWEWPGGGLEDGEEPQAAAFREFTEETGLDVPEGEVVHGWRAGPEDNYQGYVYAVDEQFAVGTEGMDPEEVQNIGWVTPDEAEKMDLRPEAAQTDYRAFVEIAVSGNEEQMDDESVAAADEGLDDSVFVGPIPVHGVVAPEGVESGDSRGFSEGSMTSRPLRIPFRWQKTDIGGHDGAVTVGSVDRIMRKDGLIHWEGLLMNTEEANELVDLIQFFDNRYGVSVDGDKGSLDEAASQKNNGTWFDAVRAAGLTAVAIPAFAEAYVSLGPHPDMPAEMDSDGDMGEVMVAGACSKAMLAFKRGPGWVTNPKETSRIHAYWTEPGQPGFEKIGWGTPGDWTRAKALIGEKIAKNSPEKMKYLNQIISQWHFDALGYWPGDLDKPGNKTSAEAKAERAARTAASAASAGASAGAIEMDEEGNGWEAVLVSSGARVKPPTAYFHQNPDSGPLVIEEPDESGLRRTYGYAAQWGVCHVGMDGRCVEPPRTFSSDYPDFHLGRTRTAEGFVPTGVLTYGIGHRDAETILSESAEQAYFDNINHAWAAVRVGEDEVGIWFSGVVLPGIPEDHLTKIAASGQVSGEWLRGSMRACLTVNVPGFGVHQPSVEYDNEGNVLALAASAFGSFACGESPAERMTALAKADAEARFENLREKWGA